MVKSEYTYKAIHVLIDIFTRVVREIFLSCCNSSITSNTYTLNFYQKTCLCGALLSVSFSLVVTCWERADLLAFICFLLFVSLFHMRLHPH